MTSRYTCPPPGMGLAFAQNKDGRPASASKTVNQFTQALRVALTSGAGEPSQWAIVWYRRGGNKVGSKGSGHRQYGGRRWFDDLEQAIKQARDFIAKRPALTGNTLLEVEDEGYYGGKDGKEWIIEVRVLDPVEPELDTEDEDLDPLA